MTVEPIKDKKRILIIDDTKPIRILLLKTFEKEYIVYLDERGLDGVRTMQEFKGDISLVILDYDMPDLNGYQVLQRIRKIDPHVPVIVVSARLSEDRVMNLKQLGVTLFLAKPVNLNRLKTAVAEILGEESGQ